jgi:hypothetical protein
LAYSSLEDTVTSFVVALIIGIFLKSSLLLLIAFYGAIAFSIYGIYRDLKTVAQERKIYQHDLKVWHKSYHCSDCGNIFIYR